jgi:hypothetical protein
MYASMKNTRHAQAAYINSSVLQGGVKNARPERALAQINIHIFG